MTRLSILVCAGAITSLVLWWVLTERAGTMDARIRKLREWEGW